jgi:hypothetical protein
MAGPQIGSADPSLAVPFAAADRVVLSHCTNGRFLIFRRSCALRLL